MAFASLVNAAETARQQGLDLYREQASRIMAAMEFEARFLPPNNTPPPPRLTFAPGNTWDIAYNEFHDRLGYPLPNMTRALAAFRPTGSDHQMEWETLTHGDIGAIGLPPPTQR